MAIILVNFAEWNNGTHFRDICTFYKVIVVYLWRFRCMLSKHRIQVNISKCYFRVQCSLYSVKVQAYNRGRICDCRDYLNTHVKYPVFVNGADLWNIYHVFSKKYSWILWFQYHIYRVCSTTTLPKYLLLGPISISKRTFQVSPLSR